MVGGSLVKVVPVELVKRADLKGFDISSVESSGDAKSVIRRYQQACGYVCHSAAFDLPSRSS